MNNEIMTAQDKLYEQHRLLRLEKRREKLIEYLRECSDDMKKFFERELDNVVVEIEHISSMVNVFKRKRKEQVV